MAVVLTVERRFEVRGVQREPDLELAKHPVGSLAHSKIDSAAKKHNAPKLGMTSSWMTSEEATDLSKNTAPVGQKTAVGPKKTERCALRCISQILKEEPLAGPIRRMNTVECWVSLSGMSMMDLHHYCEVKLAV
ncbi:hypothetical protein EYF80_011034 [Liparis tanakae]|uniref:Uncharacterized protein n=1 Tax=Liparis tanakae TaxID=230148 RepID=A0A4Z2IN05_9TELE|nr:hypothetical protein EYF80_011034 [Liparis tanakae]